MKLASKLVIGDLHEEYHQTFLDLCEALELSRGQLLTLLMISADVVDGSLDAVITDEVSQGEWRDLVLQRIFSVI